MALELNVLISAVGAISSLVKDTVVSVQAIRSGMMAKNEEAKEQLTESLKQIEQNLQHAGELSLAAESYFQTYENIVELLSLSRRAERFVKDNIDELRDRSDPNYNGDWRVLEAMFETIDSRRDAPQKVVLAIFFKRLLILTGNLTIGKKQMKIKILLNIWLKILTKTHFSFALGVLVLELL